MIRGEAGGILIAASRKPAGGVMVAEPHARVTDRGDRRRDTGAIHILDRARRRPVDQRLLPGLQPFDRGAELGRGMMMVDIYSV
jgi:hypothetical protein